MTREECIARVNSRAREIFLRDKMHTPLSLLFKENQLITVGDIRSLMSNSATKVMFTSVLRDRVSEVGADMVVTVTEAWAYRSKKINDHTVTQLLQGEITPSQLTPADRHEQLIVTVEAQDGFRAMYLHDIVRDGEDVQLKPYESHVMTASNSLLGGKMFGIFQPAKPVDGEADVE